MSISTNDASLAQSSLAEQQMRAITREAESSRRVLNGGAPIDKDKKLRQACEGFEAVFIQKMWEGMRASLPKDGLMTGSKEEKFWQGMYDQELGKSMASSGGIGLADMMVGQLSRNLQSASEVTASASSRTPMNIDPVPLMPNAPLNAGKVPAAGTRVSLAVGGAASAAQRGAGNDMYSGNAALHGAVAGADADNAAVPAADTTPPEVKSALAELADAAASESLIVTTRTFSTSGASTYARPVRLNTRTTKAVTPLARAGRAAVHVPTNIPAQAMQTQQPGGLTAQTGQAARVGQSAHAGQTVMTMQAGQAGQAGQQGQQGQQGQVTQGSAQPSSVNVQPVSFAQPASLTVPTYAAPVQTEPINTRGDRQPQALL